MPGGLTEAAAIYHEQPTPPLIIVEAVEEPDALLRNLDALAEVCDPGTKVMRVAGEPRASILIAPKSGQTPLTEAALARLQAQNQQVGNFDGPERRPLAERCLVGFGSTSGPPMLPVLYNNHYAISQSRDVVALQVEMVHDVRLLRVGGAHEPANMRKWMGDSVAHWEGETLVVDSRNFRPDQTFRGASADMRVTERLTRISPTQILYQFRVEDPATFKSPLEGEVAWNLTKDHIYEYACHEGNYALPGILAGARIEEKEALAAPKAAPKGGGDVWLGVEYYADYGALGTFVPADQQQHTLFGVVDFKVFGVDVNLGAGFGLTGGSDTFVTKMIIGRAF